MDETQPLLPRPEDDASQQLRDGHVGPSTPDSDTNEDIDHPFHWPQTYKWGVVALLAAMAFTVTFTCISVVPVASHIIADLSPASQPSKSASVLLVTIWELGEAAGPLLIAPLSEVFGRYPVFNAANTLFIVGVTLAAFSQSTGLLIFARFLTGCAVASNVLNPAVIGDVFPPAKRGSAMSIVMLAPLLGGAVGPAIAGTIAQEAGWRQVMWMSGALAVVCEVLFLTLFRETYHVAILKRRLVCEEGGEEAAKPVSNGKKGDSDSVIWTAVKRPAKVFSSSVVLQMLSLYGAVTFSFFYNMSTTLPDILHDVYDFPPTLIGTSFLCFSIGSALGILVCNTCLDRIYQHLQRKHGAGDSSEPSPEARLPLAIGGAFALPITIALYGWSAQLHLPVWTLLLSVVLLGFSLILAVVPLMAYVVDAFGKYSASAMTAVLISRCLAGSFLPLATAPLTERLGYGWGFLVLAGLALGLAPVPMVVMKFGSRWRQECTFTAGE